MTTFGTNNDLDLVALSNRKQFCELIGVNLYRCFLNCTILEVMVGYPTEVGMHSIEGLTGNLPRLLHSKLPLLKALVLRCSKLNLSDLSCLAQACLEDKLPALTHLHTYGNNVEVNDFIQLFDRPSEENKRLLMALRIC